MLLMQAFDLTSPTKNQMRVPINITPWWYVGSNCALYAGKKNMCSWPFLLYLKRQIDISNVFIDRCNYEYEYEIVCELLQQGFVADHGILFHSSYESRFNTWSFQ